MCAKPNSIFDSSSKIQIQIEIALALPDFQRILILKIKPETTLEEAIALSNILHYCPNHTQDDFKYGIHSKVVHNPSIQTLKEGDRIEIYRPLLCEPKEKLQALAQAKEATKNSH